MSIVNVVAKLRLTYHLNMIDAVNVANQLKIISDDKANHANKKHFKECLDCYERLGLNLPKVFKDFKDEP